jgi:hypothetical protein
MAWASAPKYTPKRLGIGAGTNAQTEAARTATAGLGKRAPRVGCAIRGFIAVVVRQPIGQHDEQPPRRPPRFSNTAAPCRIAAPSLE